MAKNFRGRTLHRYPARGRGTCPTCGRTAVKVLWPGTLEGRAVKVCKHCR